MPPQLLKSFWKPKWEIGPLADMCFFPVNTTKLTTTTTVKSNQQQQQPMSYQLQQQPDQHKHAFIPPKNQSLK